MAKETGTLAELNVKPGDVVECVGLGRPSNSHYVTFGKQYAILRDGWFIDDEGDLCRGHSNMFRIVSRASATPKTWGEMTDEEKSALLLADYQGKTIEFINGYDVKDWKKAVPKWADFCSYRVKPEPKRETVYCWWNGHNVHNKNHTDRTHRITFDLIDGKPDCASIRMEELW